jgi:hypothetical protein
MMLALLWVTTIKYCDQYLVDYDDVAQRRDGELTREREITLVVWMR